MKILGISCFYHDSAASIIINNQIIAATQEERFTRIKNDENFPTQSIQFCLEEANLQLNDLDAIVFYEKPFLKFERLLETYVNNAPSSLKSFVTSMPVWLKDKLFLKKKIYDLLKELDKDYDKKKVPLLFSEHHLSHAASSFYVSPFSEALIVVMDGVGEYATTSLWQGKDNQIKKLYEQHFPDSIGMLYSAFTQLLGFKVNNGEYKMMGLAPYSFRENQKVNDIVKRIKEEIVTIHDDGSINMNQRYFKYTKSLKMIHQKRFEDLFGIAMRKPSDETTLEHALIAGAIQQVTEEIVFKTLQFAKDKYPHRNLCLAGGVALNCVLNGKLKESNLFDDIFIQPAAGDAGGSLGAALAVNYMHFNQTRKMDKRLFNPYLGVSFSNDEIEKELKKQKINYQRFNDIELLQRMTNALIENKIIGHFRGKAEFGPRALGNRSIFANPLDEDVQLQLNLKIKKRESFRPFAPIILKDDFEKYFDYSYDSPYMLMVHHLKEEYRKETTDEDSILEQAKQKRSPFPGITHVDFSSRIQTISEENNSFAYKLLNHFKEKTGYGILVNTSFNVNEEPIINSPKDAINCFNSTEIDILVLENYWIEK